MATYVLKQTLYWSANPTETLTDLSGSGASIGRSITAAESHDGSDTTYERVRAPGDNASLEGDADLDVRKLLQTASVVGDIVFARVKYRGKYAKVGTGSASGSIQPTMNNTGGAVALQGVATDMTTAFVSSQQDFTTDPVNGGAWTNAKVNALDWGVRLHGGTSDPGIFNTEARTDLSEFSVELWGNAEPLAGDVTVTALDGTGVGGAVATTAPDATVAVDGVNATAVGGALTTPADVASIEASAAVAVADGGLMDTVQGNLDPTVVTNLAAAVDGGSALVTLRSNTAPLYDENLGTYASDADGFGVPGTATGTLTVNGSGVAQTSIDGLGAIGGIVFHAFVRARKDAHVTLSNYRMFHGAAMLAAPAEGPTTPPYADFTHVQTALVTVDGSGNPWDWPTLYAAIVAGGFYVKVDYSFSGGHQFDESVQLDVAEMWCEVWGPVGSAPEVIELRQVFGEHRKTVVVGSQV